MPNRILKESVCTSESLNQLSWFEQVFFDHLIVNCDDYGRMDARPAVLKAKLFPLSESVTFKDIESGLQSLVRVGCVQLYESGGKPYLFLPSWEKHQTRRARKSKYPDPSEKNPTSENNCMQMNADESSRKQMSPYSYSGTYSYSGCENGNGNEFENEKHPVVPQGTDDCAEKQKTSTDQTEQSESLTVETARGTGKRKSADHSTTSERQKRFEEFWHHYPRRVGRGAAEKSWEKLRPDKVLFERILSALDRQKLCDDWQRDGGRYIPYPATWLNQKRWEDDLGTEGPMTPAENSGAPPGEPAELPPDIAKAKKRHEEAMKRFASGKGSWEDLVPE